MKAFSKSSWKSSCLARKTRAIVPIMAATGIQLTGNIASQVFQNGVLQAECLAAVMKRWPADFAVTFMDLSVETEAFGAQVIFSDNEPPNIQAPIIEDEDGIDKLPVPPVGAGRTGETLKCITACVNCLDKPVLGGMIGPYSLAGRLADMTEFMIMAASEPETAHKLLEKCTAFLVEYARAIKAAGAAGVMIAEPAAGLISPEMNREFSSEYIARIVQAVSDDSFLVIIHNCGHSDRQIPEILSAGADAIHCGNSVSMTDILSKVPAGYPAMGNIDPVGILKLSDPEKVYQATVDLLAKCADFPNFILSSGCDVPMAAPVANLDAFFRALREYNERAAGSK